MIHPAKQSDSSVFTWEGCAALATFLCSFGDRGKGWTTLSLLESSRVKLSASCDTQRAPADGATRPLSTDCPSPTDNDSLSAISEHNKEQTLSVYLRYFLYSYMKLFLYFGTLCLHSSSVFWKVYENKSKLNCLQNLVQDKVSLSVQIY